MSNGTSNAGFAYAWGPNKAQYWSLKTVLELSYSKVFHNSFLQFVQSKMINIQVMPSKRSNLFLINKLLRKHLHKAMFILPANANVIEL